MPDKEFRVKVVLTGVEDLANRLGKQIEKAVSSVTIGDKLLKGMKKENDFFLAHFESLIRDLNGKMVTSKKEAAATEPIIHEKKATDLEHIMSSFGPLLNKIPGGPMFGQLLSHFGKTQNNLTAKPQAPVQSKPAQGGAAAEGGGGGSMLSGMGAGAIGLGVAGGMMVVDLLQKIVGLLTSLAPIQALLTVIETIFKLALLPLAMILMAVLMPILVAVLQEMAKFGWKKFFEMTQKLSEAVAKFLPQVYDFLRTINIDIMDLGTLIRDIVGLPLQFIKVLIEGYTALFKAAIAVLTPVINSVDAGIKMIVDGVKTLWKDFIGGLQILGSVFSTIGNTIFGGLSVIGSAALATFAWFASILGPAIAIIQNGITSAWNILSSIWNWFVSFMQPAFSTISNVLGAIQGAINSLNPSNIVKLATGGAVVRQGLAYIHSGETVLPSGAVAVAGAINIASAPGSPNRNSAPVVNVTVSGNTISKDIDINVLAAKVSKAIGNEVRMLKTW